MRTLLVVAAASVAALAAGAGHAAIPSTHSPKVLTMEVADVGGPSPAGVVFANNVRRLSKGDLLISFRAPSVQTAEGEERVIAEVERGSAEMGQIPTRAWDTQGLAAFTALQAPFLITDYALLKRVLQSPVGRGMLGGTRAFGVRTLGLAARDLRIPLGARRPFVAAADFRGATLRVPSASRVSTAMLEALGAKAASVASGVELAAALRSGAVDGAETSIYYIFSNGYYQVAKYVTTNLVFFPGVESFAINERVFQALTPQQRSILRRAATATTSMSFVGIGARDQAQLRLLCIAGLRVTSSTSSQLAELRRAEQPVYAMLRRDRATATRIARIQALKKRTKPMPLARTPAGCAGAAPRWGQDV